MIAAKEAACSLQEQWESQVLAETSAVGESSLQELLFGAQGIVWQYVKGPAAPFVKGGPQGYQPTSVRGQRIAFNPRFIDFLNQGNLGRDDTKENYTVTLRDRDSMKQVRIAIDKLPETLAALVDGSIVFASLE